MTRISSVLVVFFTILAHAAVEHGTVFPITETPEVYSAEDNYYDAQYATYVRHSYTPAKSGYCTVTTSYESSSFSRYLYYYGTDNTFSNPVTTNSGSYTVSYSFVCEQSKTYYFAVRTGNTSYTSYKYNIKASLDAFSETVYPLTATFAPYTYKSNSSLISEGLSGIKLSYEPSATGTYVFVSKARYSRYLYYYSTDATFATRNNYFSHSSSPIRTFFSLTAGQKYYFAMYQSSTSYLDDEVSVRMAPSLKVNADTLGPGYVYVGTGTRNNDSSYVANDTVPLHAYTRSNSRFVKWEKVSGTCSIVNPTAAQTGVVISSNCKVRAVFKAGEVYPITKTAKKYNLYDHFYSGTPSNGVRFSFVAPKSGGFVIKYTKDSTEWSYLKRYQTGAFSSYDFSKSVSTSLIDTVLLNAGDSVFYLVTNDYTRDSTMSFSMSYDTIPSIWLTIQSESSRCSTKVGSMPVLKGQVAFVEAFARKGYRPNGWTFVSGSHKFSDSTAYSIKDTILEDTKIKLRCKAANLIEITDKRKTYVTQNDFYEVSPSGGLRFHYEAPTSGIFVLKFEPQGFRGTYRYYGADSTFSSAKRTYSNTSNEVSFNVVAAAANEEVFESTIPYATEYWDDPVSVVALRGGTVKIDSQTRVDTLAVGDQLALSTSLDSGAHFVKWTVVSGKGAFVDSSELNTSFILKGTGSVVVKPVSSTLPLYQLTDSYRGYTFKDNSTNSRRSVYGIRAVLNPKDSGMYAIVMKTEHSAYIYNYSADSTFYSYSSTTCSSSPCRTLLTVNANQRRYFQFIQNTASYREDSVWVKAVKTSHLRADTSGIGYAYVGSSGSYNYDSTHIAGDTIPVRASTTHSDFRFSKWSVASGSCKIIDSTKANTSIIPNGDCTVKAHFVLGTVYPITAVSTKYTMVDNYYSRGASYGVRFKFVAPSDGDYTMAFSSLNLKMTIERYTSDAFNSYVTRTTSATSKYETLSLTAGQTIYYMVRNYSTADTLLPFWVSYSISNVKVVLTADSNGTVAPSSGYSTAWMGTAYPVTATANSNFRFDKWIVESGSATFDDPNAYKTMVIPKTDVTLKATFKHGSVYALSTTKKNYNIQAHHYSDSDSSTVRFSWTPGDTNHYLLTVDSITGVCTYYGTDSLFASSVKRYVVGGKSYVLVQGSPNKTYYFTVKDTVPGESRYKNFTMQMVVPNVLYVESTRGRAVPSEYVYVAPGADTLLYATPYGGYVFDSWIKVDGKVKIEDPSQSRTRAEPQSSYCHVKANYVFDMSAEPSLTITDLDLSNHPGICAQVSVVDENSKKPIAGLEASDFVLFQDEKSLPIQMTTVQSVSGVSVALVVDESGSMSGIRMTSAKEAIRQFINEMGPYDRTAIIGFTGGSNADVHQAMTSDQTLLLNAVDRLKADGDGTNINTGTKVGVEQVVGETNPTAVIVFSDGSNNDDATTTPQAVNLANSLNTNIYSIAVATTTNAVLKDLADGTHGSYTEVPNASQLADIYSSVRSAVQARYVLCYQSPDAVWDGDTHTVVIKTKFLNKDASDTAYWNEASQPPIVDLTPETWKMVGVNQPQNKGFTIGVYVNSRKGIKEVKLYMRNVSLRNDSYTTYTMTQENDSLWNFVLPDSMVKFPGIDFYVTATDSIGLTGKSPAVMSPAKEPHTIPVKNDVPYIRLDSIACMDTTGGKGSIRFKITDDNGVNNAIFYYKDSMAVIFDERRMSESQGYWTAYVPAKAFANGIIEYYVRAIDELGASARWLKAQNSYMPVCNRKIMVRDVEDSIAIVNGNVSGDPISRETSKIRLSLVTEDFTEGKDTVTASLSCLVSGDIENNIKLVEKRSGYYETAKAISKNEYSAKRDDGSISCSGSDTLVAEYKDPLYGTYARDTVIVGDTVEFSYRFLNASGKKDLDSLESGDSVQFKLRLTSVSKSIHKKDTLNVLLFTNKYDSLWVKAVETGDYTSTFEYSGTFYFAYDKDDLESSKLDALFNMNASYNRVVIKAGIKKDKLGWKRDSLVVYSNYIPADTAEIYDADKDGEADSIRIHYVSKQKDGVAAIDTLYWNKAGGTWQSVSKKRFKLQSGRSWVEARLEDSFDYGATAADAEEAPYLKMTRPKGGFSQKMEIKDRIGAVPVKAVKRPGTISIDEFMECTNEVPPDTLEITLSEPVENTGDENAWKKLFTYSEDCKDTLDYSLNISKLLEKDSAGLVWTFVLADHNLMTYNCIRTNPKATYVDKYDNPMGRGGITIDGSNGNVYIYEVAPAPAVSGIKNKEKWIAPGDEDWSRVPDTLSVIRVASIMPYKATVTIFDSYSNVVTTFKRKFGDDGEMSQKIRGNGRNHAKTGFLHWNNRSDDGRHVGTGVYIWRIDFKFKDGHTEYRLVKTGVKRKK